ncbi:MAG: hypothetical protein LBM07_07200 [Culturomica sp.]|jgi:hypothetical protein|nr:hypothetical protein [Culturomica sp.]
MNKKTFFMTVALCYTTVSGVFAQESIKINENSSKGVYVRIGGGYSLGIGKTSGAPNDLMPNINTVTSKKSDYISKFGTVETDESTNTTKKTNAAFSLGKGINMALDVGYMFNSNIGVELSGSYLMGTNNKVEDKNSSRSHRIVATSSNNHATVTETNASSSSCTTNSMKRTYFSLTPAVKFVAPINEKLSLYSRIGVVIPILNKMIYEYSDENRSSYSQRGNQSVNTSSHSNENKKMEFSSYFKLGYSAAIGVDFSIGERINLFGELNGVSNSFETKKRTITKWTKSSSANGSQNLLKGLDTRDKETEYLKEYVVDNKKTSTTNKNSPRKDVSFSLPASSIGVTVGLAYRF